MHGIESVHVQNPFIIIMPVQLFDVNRRAVVIFSYYIAIILLNRIQYA